MAASFEDIGADQRLRRYGIRDISADGIFTGNSLLTQQNMSAGDFKRYRFLFERKLQDFPDSLPTDIKGNRLPEPYLLAIDKRESGGILQLPDKGV